MRAVLWEGHPYNVTVANVPVPTIQNQTDAIVRVSSAGICGTDLHTYHGFSGSAEPPWVLGHEAIGYISEIGNSVEAHAVGDYVVIPDILPTGHLNLEPSTGDTYGVGPDRGDGGSEYVRVPYADQALIPVPPPDNSTSRSKETDYLFVSDIFATAWAGLSFSGFEAGDTVAVFGAGPVGLLAAYAARLRGASKVYVVDHVQRRLDLAAANVGAGTVVVPISFAGGADPVAAILAREPAGVRRSVDCVGFEAVDRDLNNDEGVVVAWMVAVTGRHGGIGQVGIYRTQEDSPGRPLAGTVAGNVTFPSSDFFTKGLRFQSGPVDPKLLAPELVPLISSGTVDLSWIVSSEISIEDAPEYYGRFSRHEEEKVIIKF
ncbi:putative zinc-binding alcohol dehydrogenase [Lasiodiplodia hormozganensis]|uniref:Zinc-binding alcohol dehydrogenase n=1 Tax=Lasiodiplodia hormozganensis TaxID=869390 RepID=A0AA40CVX3_9PEZI|nr:putative zinc-binding alcohol dehydrogenase [Lasiodiplodia hormozganensis]